MALWRIDEEETPLASLCTVAEQQEAAAFAAPRRRLEYLAWHALLHALLPEAHAAHDPEGGPVLVFPSSGQNTPATYREGSRTGKIAYGPTPACTKTPDPKTFHSNTPGSATRCKRVSSPRCATSASAIRTATRRSFSLRSLARVDIEPADSDFSRAARRFISPQEQALQPCALPEVLFPALVWCAKEAVYKWVRISGLSLLHDIRITEIHPETTRTNPSGTGFPALEAFHRLTVTAAGKTLQLHGFTVEGICCVYGIG